jgi:ubiquitin C-terminal hydrolase
LAENDRFLPFLFWFHLVSPKALLLHLKRFIVEEKIYSPPEGTSDENSHPNSPQAPSYELVFKKNKAAVAIPANLSLEAFQVESTDTHDQTAASASASAGEYSLKSVVHHIGARASSGHYTADAIRLCEKEEEEESGDSTARTADTSTPKELEEKWVIFDDGNSAPTTLEKITKNISKQRTAYMLLYTMNEEEKANV